LLRVIETCRHRFATAFLKDDLPAGTFCPNGIRFPGVFRLLISHEHFAECGPMQPNWVKSPGWSGNVRSLIVVPFSNPWGWTLPARPR